MTLRSISCKIYWKIPEPALMPSENIRWNDNKIKNKSNIRSGIKLQQTCNYINYDTELQSFGRLHKSRLLRQDYTSLESLLWSIHSLLHKSLEHTQSPSIDTKSQRHTVYILSSSSRCSLTLLYILLSYSSVCVTSHK